MLTGLTTFLAASSESTAKKGCQEKCFNPCMPDFVFYADFIGWQVHPDDLEYARDGGISTDPDVQIDQRGRVLSPKCQLVPGLRLKFIFDLNWCEWNFYAQYTWLSACLDNQKQTRNNSTKSLYPLIANLGISGQDPINFVRAKWVNHYNVFDFGMGRTFSINCCFDFHPHFGFKAAWQGLKYTINYENTKRLDIYNRVNCNGIGLRGGFDAAWKFSPCFSAIGGLALSSVWSIIEISRQDYFNPNIDDPNSVFIENLNLRRERCALIPVTELFFGLKYDELKYCCYNVFFFIGWENQVWWNMNRFLFAAKGENENGFLFGPHGNITYQGLIIRGGLCF